MKKIEKIKLMKSSYVLESEEMKNILGGSGNCNDNCLGVCVTDAGSYGICMNTNDICACVMT